MDDLRKFAAQLHNKMKEAKMIPPERMSDSDISCYEAINGLNVDGIFMVPVDDLKLITAELRRERKLNDQLRQANHAANHLIGDDADLKDSLKEQRDNLQHQVNRLELLITRLLISSTHRIPEDWRAHAFALLFPKEVEKE